MANHWEQSNLPITPVWGPECTGCPCPKAITINYMLNAKERENTYIF